MAADGFMRMAVRRATLLSVLAVTLAKPAWAVDPRVASVTPPGAQAGTEVELRFQGDRLSDTRKILFYNPGFETLSLEEVTNEFVRAKIRIAPDCELGEHPLRLLTDGGVSELRTFYVGPFPVVNKDTERESDDPLQSLPMNVTVNGSLPEETIDRYAVQATAGQRLSIEVESMRLGRGLYDPYLTVLDPQGKVLARSDDTALFVQDCFVSLVAPEDGVYTIELRETSYEELGAYRMHVGTFPRPIAVYPAGGPAGREMELTFVEPVTGNFTRSWTVPEPSEREFGVFGEQDGVTAPSWNRFRVRAFPNLLESEPNDRPNQATAATHELPLAFNGIIEKESDVDWFRFEARKDQTFDVRVQARSLRSPLDAVLLVARADGGNIESNDDSGGPDSYVRFKVPEDGAYALRVADHLDRGGPDYVYRVELEPVQPGLRLYVPDTSQYDTQTRKSVVVARGNRFPLIVNARRQDFGGDLKLSMENFPPGITLHADLMAENKDSMAVVFEAETNAPLGGNLANLVARLANEEDEREIEGRIRQNFDLVQDGNQGVYYQTWVDRIAVAVVEELPFRIRIEPPKAPLVRDGTLPVKVVAERDEGFDEPIKINFPVRPDGVSCQSEITIPKDENHAIYTLSANGNAEIKEHRIVFVAFADTRGGTAYVSSQLTPLTITESFFEGSIPMAKTMQGEPVQVICELTSKESFEGNATVTLAGLPPGAKAEPREVTKDDTKVVFDVVTEKDARTGLHRSLFCQMELNYQDEIVTQSFGGRGKLRIDAPPPPPEQAEAAAPQTAAQ